MDYELISDEEYGDLPENSEDCFVAFEAICRRNMTGIIATSPKDQGLEQEIRSQYMAAVSAVAIECGVPNLQLAPYDYENFYNVFGPFSRAVQGEIARLRIRGRALRQPYSVQLAPTTRTKIEHYIGRIRHAIATSDLRPDRQEALGAKLDELVVELTNRRLGFGKTLAVLNAVLIGMAAATTIAAEGPGAVTHIMQLIGADKETEDAARLRLTPPQKALPAPPKATVVTTKSVGPDWSKVGNDVDDEIPF